MVRAVERKIFALEHVDPATGQTDRVRRARELEIDVRKLFGVLSLPGRASSVAKGLTVRFGRERFARGTVPRRVHEDQSWQKPDYERECLRGIRRRDRESSARVLLFDFSKHASQSAPRIRHGAPALAADSRTDFDRVRL